MDRWIDTYIHTYDEQIGDEMAHEKWRLRSPTIHRTRMANGVVQSTLGDLRTQGTNGVIDSARPEEDQGPVSDRWAGRGQILPSSTLCLILVFSELDGAYDFQVLYYNFPSPHLFTSL